MTWTSNRRVVLLLAAMMVAGGADSPQPADGDTESMEWRSGR